MTRDEFMATTAPLIRHSLTALAGVLAARGFAIPDDAVANWSASAVLLIGGLTWSLVSKTKWVSGLVSGAQVSDVDLLANQFAALRKSGASPLLLAHLAQTMSAFATNEILAANPQPTPEVVPAAVVPSPAAGTAAASATSDAAVPALAVRDPAAMVEPLPADYTPQPAPRDFQL